MTTRMAPGKTVASLFLATFRVDRNVMTKYLNHAIGLCLAMGLLSCESAFEPKTDFIDRPVLYGVLSPSIYGPTEQHIMLSQTYNAEGTRPPSNIIDRPITSARVVLDIAGDEYVLEEALKAVPGTDGNPMLRHVYTASVERFLPGQPAEISVQLPDGRTLSARTTAPPMVHIMVSYPFNHGITTTVRGTKAGQAWTISWTALEDHLYWPKLTILCEKETDGPYPEYLMQEVPMTFVRQGDRSVPVYPSCTWDPSCTFTFDAIDSAMAKLSEGDPDKQAYKIVYASFSVLIYDPHLARYYASVHGSLDEYSIRSDPTTYTNVEGGLGVLGSETGSGVPFTIDPFYAAAFGYRGGG